MKKIIITILCITFISGIIGCAEAADPVCRIKNAHKYKADVVLITSEGKTINIEEVLNGQITEYQRVSRGSIKVTAVIQNEPHSADLAFNAMSDTKYTIEIQPGNIPIIIISQE